MPDVTTGQNPDPVVLYDETGAATTLIGGALPVFDVTGLVPKVYDEIDITYNTDGTQNVITFFLAGTLIATLTCSYVSGNLTKVKRT